MDRPTSPKERQKQQDAARANARQAGADRERRRKRMLAVVGLTLVGVLALSTLGGFLASTSGSGTASTTTTVSSTTTSPPAGAAEMPAVEPGATLAGPTPCPAEDGSSPRTTQFSGPPPTCIDLALSYQAVVHTTVGDLTLMLNTEQAPGAVNNFVVLARYHYFDGQAFAPIIKKQLAAVVPRFTGSLPSPGYTLPSEVPAAGQARGPYTVSAIPADGSGAFDAAFFITTFSNAPDTDPEPTTFGLVLDGDDTMRALDAAGSEEGSPSSAILITGIEITPLILGDG